MHASTTRRSSDLPESVGYTTTGRTWRIPYGAFGARVGVAWELPRSPTVARGVRSCICQQGQRQCAFKQHPANLQCDHNAYAGRANVIRQRGSPKSWRVTLQGGLTALYQSTTLRIRSLRLCDCECCSLLMCAAQQCNGNTSEAAKRWHKDVTLPKAAARYRAMQSRLYVQPLHELSWLRC